MEKSGERSAEIWNAVLRQLELRTQCTRVLLYMLSLC